MRGDGSADASHGSHRFPVLDVGAVSHTGFVRTVNEDAHFVSPWLCLVADGMGGPGGGDIASRTVVEVFERAVARPTTGGWPLQIGELEPLVERANRLVRERAEVENKPAMGSTLVGVAVVDNGGMPSTVVFNVGDSRCYELTPHEIRRVSSDHSYVAELVAAGRLARHEAATHPLRHVVTRAIGGDERVSADFTILGDEPGRLLLCSDGVSGEVPDADLGRLLRIGDPREAALAVIEAVLAGPARDNATAVVVDVGVDRDDEDTMPKGHAEAAAAEITAPREGDGKS